MFQLEMIRLYPQNVPTLLIIKTPKIQQFNSFARRILSLFTLIYICELNVTNRATANIRLQFCVLQRPHLVYTSDAKPVARQCTLYVPSNEMITLHIKYNELYIRSK
jgi:hypothetical protein